jgi:hypothetical protein
MIDGIVGYNLQGGHYTSQLRIHTSLEVPMNAEIEASDIVSFNYFHKWERVSIIVKYTSHLNPQFQVKLSRINHILKNAKTRQDKTRQILN